MPWLSRRGEDSVIGIRLDFLLGCSCIKKKRFGSRVADAAKRMQTKQTCPAITSQH